MLDIKQYDAGQGWSVPVMEKSRPRFDIKEIGRAEDIILPRAQIGGNGVVAHVIEISPRLHG
jgi:hypothetical protein